jgi:hypothetical protein
MLSIFQSFGSLDLTPVVQKLSESIVQPFVHSFQSVAPGFLPHMKSIITNDPGLVGGLVFILIFYSVVSWVQDSVKARVTVTNKKPSVIYREGFPKGIDK